MPDRAWRNWSRTVRETAAEVLAPDGVDALAAAIRRWRGPLRVMGAGHSWSPLGTADPGHARIHLAGPAFEGLKGGFEGDEVWVGAATRLSDLHGLLAAHGRSLANVGSISAQTVAGLVATGTHGTGVVHPCLSAAVTGVRLVDAAGEVHEHSDEASLAFHRLSLGCLGVYVALRIRTVPLFWLAERRAIVPLDEGPERLAAIVAAEPETGLRHRFTWFPYGRRAQIKEFAALPPPEVLPVPFGRPGWRYRLEGKLLGEWLFGRGLLGLTGLAPGAVPAVCRFAEAVHFQTWEEPRTGRLFERINEHGIPRHHETEWAVPIEAAPEAWRALRAAIETRGLPADFLQELRTARHDGIALSAARERDVCWVGLYQTTAWRWEESLAVAEDVLGGLGGRPHWAKSFDPARVAARVGAPFAAFEQVRARTDPAGRFLGPWHRALGLGP